jgi:hypothetical protein
LRSQLLPVLTNKGVAVRVVNTFFQRISLLRMQALRVGTITAAEKGKTMFVINGVGDKLYWAYSLTDEATDGRAKVRSKNLEEAKARLRQEFQGWDVALHILEVQHPSVILLSKFYQPYMVLSQFVT